MQDQSVNEDLATTASNWRMAFGILVPADGSDCDDHEAALRLTRRRLLLHNRTAHHQLFEGPSFNAIAELTHEAGFQFVLIQQAGHVITDTECFSRGLAGISQLPFVIAGFFNGNTDLYNVIDEHCVLVNLVEWAQSGRPLLPSVGIEKLVAFPEAMRRSVLYCGALDSEAHSRAMRDLYGDVQYWKQKVWFVNTDHIFTRDTIDEFVGTIRQLIALPSGLMANQILHALSFDKDTKVVFYDRNPHALAFRKFLLERWDGKDYETAIRSWVDSQPSISRSINVEKLTEGAGDLYTCIGSREDFVVHWNKYRSLAHEFIVADLFASSARYVVDRIDPACLHTILWWSNIFHSLETHTYQSEAETSDLFYQWIRALRNRNNKLTIFGLDPEGKLCAGPIDRVVFSPFAAMYYRQAGDVDFS